MFKACQWKWKHRSASRFKVAYQRQLMQDPGGLVMRLNHLANDSEGHFQNTTETEALPIPLICKATRDTIMADAEKQTIHIDEEVGQDSPEVDGSQSKPYKTLQFAYLQHLDQAQYLVKKKENDDEPAE